MDKQDEALSALVRQQATRYTADEQLRAQIRARLLQAAATPAAPAPRPKTRTGNSWALHLAGWRNPALGFLLGVALTLLLVPRLPPLDLLRATDAELVADHVRALRIGPLYAVQSSDRHTVKPWFQGKLDYAPPVPDLAEQDFPLLGGRVAQINRNAVATLVYGRHGHVINLFVWPADSASALQTTQVRGFNVGHWSTTSMQFWAVSDMDNTELTRFVQAFQARL